MMRSFIAFVPLLMGVAAQCPLMTGELNTRAPASHDHLKRQATVPATNHLSQYEVDDTDVYMTSDVGGPIEDQNTLKAGERGPALLEDFIFRQKITHFDHERVPERAVHARGSGTYRR